MFFKRRGEEKAAPSNSTPASAPQGEDSHDQRRLRRRVIRKTCHVKVEFSVGFAVGTSDVMHMDTHTTKGRLLDLSLAGACVLTKYEITPGQEVSLEIDLQGLMSITPKAQVRWTKPILEKKGHACGVLFHTLSDEDHRKLKRFLKDLEEQIAKSASE
ncbi:MAG: PilZ domain-containing protein [Candidatus Hydrogenedentes bacterium]|nr:PilZ domain-containing protein [Candidatus Hydrogenedentota bacterium]